MTCCLLIWAIYPHYCKAWIFRTHELFAFCRVKKCMKNTIHVHRKKSILRGPSRGKNPPYGFSLKQPVVSLHWGCIIMLLAAVPQTIKSCLDIAIGLYWNILVPLQCIFFFHIYVFTLTMSYVSKWPPERKGEMCFVVPLLWKWSTTRSFENCHHSVRNTIYFMFTNITNIYDKIQTHKEKGKDPMSQGRGIQIRSFFIKLNECSAYFSLIIHTKQLVLVT